MEHHPIIENCANITQVSNMSIEESFHNACINGQLEIIEKIKESSPDIDISSDEEKAFRGACKNGNLEIVTWLLKMNPYIDISAKDEEAFRLACTNGHLKVAQFLLKENPYIYVGALDNYSIKMACMNEKLEVVKWLSQIVPNVNIVFDDIFIDALYRRKTKALKFILEVNPNINLNSINEICSDDPLECACCDGDIELAEILLTKGYKHELFTDNDIFQVCINCNQFKMAEWLLNKKEELKLDESIVNLSYSRWRIKEACVEGNLKRALWLNKMKPTLLKSYTVTEFIELFTSVCRRNELEIAIWLYEFNIIPPLQRTYEEIFNEMCKCGNLKMCKWILNIIHNFGKNHTVDDEMLFINSAFTSACEDGRLNICKWLRDTFKDLDITYNNHQAFRLCYVNGRTSTALWLSELIDDYYVHIDKQTNRILSCKILPIISPYHTIRLEEQEEKECPICYEDEVEVQTNCGHNFCKKCIIKTELSSCPYCRQEMNGLYLIKK